MRIFNELNGRNQGVYLVREMIKERIIEVNLDERMQTADNQCHYHCRGLENGIDLCNDLLDIASLGEIEEKIKPTFDEYITKLANLED